MFDFEKFNVYQKTESLIIKLQKYLKNRSISIYLRDQLGRSSSSILLNIAEGSGKFSRKDKKNFYVISRASVQECVATIKLLKLTGYINESDYKVLYKDLEEISKMLSGLINSMLK